MIDATIEGVLMNKTPAAARELISNMDINLEKFGNQGGNIY